MGNPAGFKQSYRNPEESLSSLAVSDCVHEALSLAEKRMGRARQSLSVMDCGCGTGDYLFELERHARQAVGIEPDAAAFEVATLRKSKHGHRSKLVHGFVEDYSDPETFDLILSLTTVEHMPNARASMEKLVQLLKPGGMIYLTAPNKLWPMECHYGLPFLSYLPLPFANLYLRLSGKGKSYEDCSYARTYWGMKRLFAGLNCKIEFVLPDENSRYLGGGDTNRLRRWIRRTGIRMIRRLPWMWVISKGFVMVIQKPG